MLSAILRSFSVLALSAAPTLAPQAEGDFVERWYASAVGLRDKGEVDAARSAFEHVLERDADHLPTLHALVLLERESKHLDQALSHAARYLDVWRYLKDKPAELKDETKDVETFRAEVDPLHKRAEALRRDYVTKLLKLATQQLDRKSWHSARAMLLEALAVDPEHPELAGGLERIAKEGGNEFASGDDSGGVDPLEGVSEAWVAKNDPLHVDWPKAWEFETKHYRFKTNAGYRLLKTIAHAMEQVQVFYRQFHQYKTKGEDVPIANVFVFKNYDEYTRLGEKPIEWAGGHWDGGNVKTYDPRGGSGKGGFNDLLQILFHEASHQFTTLAGGSGVPSWLNEGMASFFEGTRLLSNGSLEWNLIAPGRLYPLLEDLHSGANRKVADVIAGKVEDPRVNYPWGWGIVYFLYNADDENGKLAYRPLMKEYFQEYSGEKHVERFTEFFVTRAAIPGITTIEAIEKRFQDFIYGLEAQDKGQVDIAASCMKKGELQAQAGDKARALELFTRAQSLDPGNPEILWKLAGAYEANQENDRAAGFLRQWMSATQPRAGEDDPFAERRAEAIARWNKLDAIAKQMNELRDKFNVDALQLGKDYEQAGFPRAALRALRSSAVAQPPNVAARELYFAISEKHQVSLESWRLIFDERTLTGFYGSDGSFKVKDGMLVAKIEEAIAPPSLNTGLGVNSSSASAAGFNFKSLFIDVSPAGDWSLSADIEIQAGSKMAGLCFGKKGDGTFQAVALLPKGVIDLATFTTVSGKTLMRTNLKVEQGWHTLRMETAGTRLVAYVDGKLALEYEFDTRSQIQGGFGLVVGTGSASFKEIRMLEYDAQLPRRAKIGRNKPPRSKDQATSATLERGGAGSLSFLKDPPPLLRVSGWIGTPPADGNLDQLLGWPVIVVFWTTYQEKQVPALEGLGKLADEYAQYQIPILLVSDEPKEKLEEWLKKRGDKDKFRYPIAYDTDAGAFSDYNIVGKGLPHALLIDTNGDVAWEGNPDYKPGAGSYLDEPLATLVAKERLAEVQAQRGKLAEADAARAQGQLAPAIALYRAIVDSGLQGRSVAGARAALSALEAEAQSALAAAEAKATAGSVMSAARMYDALGVKYAGLPQATQAKEAQEKLLKSKAYKSSKAIENRLKAAEQNLDSNKLADARTSLEATLAKLEAGSDPELKERVEFLLTALKAATNGKQVLADYRERFKE